MTQISNMANIESLLAAFQRDTSGEPWKDAHGQAMGCFDLEDIILLGLQCHVFIERIEKAWADRVDSGAVPYDLAAAKSIQSLYAQWLAPSEVVLKAVKACEARGFQVQNAGEFRRAVGFCYQPHMDIEEVHRTMDRFAAGEGVVIEGF